MVSFGMSGLFACPMGDPVTRLRPTANRLKTPGKRAEPASSRGPDDLGRRPVHHLRQGLEARG